MELSSESDDRRLPAEAALRSGGGACVWLPSESWTAGETASHCRVAVGRLGTQDKARGPGSTPSLARLRQRAAVELQERSQQRPDPIDKQEVVVVTIASELGRVEVEMSDALVRFARDYRPRRSRPTRLFALREADAELDRWESLRREHVTSNVAVLPFEFRSDFRSVSNHVNARDGIDALPCQPDRAVASRHGRAFLAFSAMGIWLQVGRPIRLLPTVADSGRLPA